VADLLDTEISDGKTKKETVALYQELRRIRLDVLELVKSGKVQLPQEAIASFEQLLGDLGRYYRDAP
jgi:hypothetical protein